MICPRCGTKISGKLKESGYFYICPSCDGRALSLSVIRKLAPPAIADDIWKRTIKPGNASEIACPACRHQMTNINVLEDTGSAFIDVCQQCHFIWFDPQELEQLPRKLPEPAKQELSAEARKVLALAEIEAMKQRHEIEQMGVGAPDHWWELILGLLRVPVEYNRAAIKNSPVLTYAIAVLMVLLTGMAAMNDGDAIARWGLIPNHFTRYFGLNFASSFFLHGGVMHLLGNLYFLMVFGDNVEDVLGQRSYLALIVCSALAGDIAHILFDPHAATPVIGASGGISGILAFYCLSFPRARVGLIILFRWVKIPVGMMLFFWIILQLVGTMNQLHGISNVSSLAHLGGAAVGIYFWFMYRENIVTKVTESTDY